MNNRIKRLRRDIEGIGFEYDHDASSARRQMHAYRHPNDPEQVLRVSEHMSDSGCTAVWKKAQSIAGLSTSGSTSPASIKERARIRRAAEREEQARNVRAMNERAAEKERELHARGGHVAAERRRSEIEDLMQPGYGR